MACGEITFHQSTLGFLSFSEIDVVGWVGEDDSLLGGGVGVACAFLTSTH